MKVRRRRRREAKKGKNVQTST